MNNIKIYATQRIDKKANLFDCSNIIPVRCGAVYDNKGDNSIIGDNTGNNISDKRMSYCELTTQYWAWKNEQADYYGFCHYRRYFSFSKERYQTDGWKTVIETYINEETQEKYAIYENDIEKIVTKYDVILPDFVDLTKVGIKSVYDQYKSESKLNVQDIDLMLKIIKNLYPDFYAVAREYIYGTEEVFCNMFIMKKQYFYEYSKWLFDILFEFERQTDLSEYSEEGYRTIGHLGERLLGIYALYLKKKKAKIGHLQMVVFSNPEATEKIRPVFKKDNTAVISFSSSEYFAPYCATAIQSIINSSSGKHNYDIVILESDMFEKTKKVIKSMIKNKENFSIRFFNVKELLSKYNLRIREHFSVETYYRLILGDVLENYDKVVYLDGDLIVKYDIYDLYQTEMKNYTIGGVVDICLSGINNGYDKGKPKYYMQHAFLKKNNLRKMVNAGVLLLNLDSIREKYSSTELLEYAQDGAFELADQDVLNSLFQDSILHLDPAWNAFDDEKGTLRAYCSSFAPKDLYEAAQKAIKNAKILHYAGTIKPWNDPGYQYAYEFWDTLRATPFYEVVIHRRIVENASYFANTVATTVMTENSRDGNMDIPVMEKKKHRKVINFLLPLGSRRREVVKKIVCFVTRKPYVKPYYVLDK